MKKILISAFLVLFVSFNSFTQKDAKEVIIKMDENFHGISKLGVSQIEIIRPNWTKTLVIKSWTLNKSEYALIVLQEPASEKGVGYLKRNKEAWNWQPAIERTLKLPPSMLMQSWMGSDIKNDDLMKISSIVADYHHKFLKDTIVDNYECYTIELLPKEDANVIWGKIIINVTKKHLLNLSAQYFDEDSDLIRVIKNSNIKNNGKKWYTEKNEIISMVDEGHKTVSTIISVEWGGNFSERFFTIKNLKNIE